MVTFTPIYPIAGEYWIESHWFNQFWEVSQTDERPAFPDKAYIKDGPEPTTDKTCKTKKGGNIALGEKDETMEGLGKKKERFSDSKRPGLPKGTPRVLDSDKLMIPNSQYRGKE